MKKKKRAIKIIEKAEILPENVSDYADASVAEATVTHKLEYISGDARTRFMEELYRILMPGGKATIVVCYWTSARAVQDPASEWPPICEQSFLYFNKGWREINKLPAIKCDFDFTYGYQVDPETAGRNTETQPFWIKHYMNTANDLHVTLTKK